MLIHYIDKKTQYFFDWLLRGLLQIEFILSNLNYCSCHEVKKVSKMLVQHLRNAAALGA